MTSTKAHPDEPCRVILIEGIPGSGKSSTAEWLCGALHTRGVAAEWVPELQPDHPVIDRPTMRQSREAGYADLCISRWRDFAARVAEEPRAPLRIIDACLFQKTLRFLLEHDHPKADLDRYLPETERALQALKPQLIYLSQRDPRAYLRSQLVGRKGQEIVDKIAAYTETTAHARRRGWRGRDGLVEFYGHYREVCDELVASSTLPLLRVDTSTENWAGTHAHISGWLDKLASERQIRRP